MIIYEVGGCLRDKIINTNNTNNKDNNKNNDKDNDIDYCVETNSYESMRDYLIEQKYEILVENKNYYTIKVKTENKKYADFTLCRKDGEYNDNRRPISCEISNIYNDLSRRDFTMNAIARDIQTNKIIDPYNGIQDIKNKIIKCVLSKDRLKEDILRLLRAFRFYVKLDFKLDEEIINCLNDKEYINLLDKLSTDRIKNEFTKCLNYSSYETLKKLKEFPLLENYLLTKFNLKIK